MRAVEAASVGCLLTVAWFLLEKGVKAPEEEIREVTMNAVCFMILDVVGGRMFL